MISLSPEALAQLEGLLQHYERIEAAENLLAAIEQARNHIARAPEAGLTAPRPYRDLAVLGLRWIEAGRYWVAYSNTSPPIINNVFYDAADIPRRL